MPADQTRQGPAPRAALIGPNRHDRLPGMLRQPPYLQTGNGPERLAARLDKLVGWVSFRGGEKDITDVRREKKGVGLQWVQFPPSNWVT